MSWSNNFRFNDTYASYYGSIDDHDNHHHAAIQLIISLKAPIQINSESAGNLSGHRFLIRPLVDHKISCPSAVAMIYLEPHSHLAFALLEQVGPSDIEILPSHIVSKIDLLGAQENWMKAISLPKTKQQHVADPRVSNAMTLLSKEPGTLSIHEAADAVGLSESRLRALMQQQIGVPMATWLLWRKLNRSANAIAQGKNLTEAALEGGFSDQAHFTRAMKRMFGITPKTALKARG